MTKHYHLWFLREKKAKGAIERRKPNLTPHNPPNNLPTQLSVKISFKNYILSYIIMPAGRKKNYQKMAKKSLSKQKLSSNGIKVSAPVVNPALKQYVNKIVKSNEETKILTNSIAYKSNITGIGFNTTGPTGFTSAFNILPVVAQGATQYNRIGNKISPVGNLLIRGHILALPTSSTSNPCPNLPFYVRVVVWRQKASMTTLTNSDILDDNVTAGGVPFDGTLDDLMIPFNKDKFVIGGVKTVKLQPNASVSTYSVENLSRYPVAQMFKMYVKLPKTITYNDTSADPSNCRWYFSAGVVNFDGSILTSSSIRANITAETVMKFKDA